VWKYEELYRLLDLDNKFNVKVVIIPLVRDGKGDKEVFSRTLSYFENNGYKTFSSYNKEKSTWLDIKSITKPDIVFFTNPHKLTFDKYYIDNFTDILTCYVPYAFVVIKTLNGHYDKRFHHLLWKYYVETKYHQFFSNMYIKKKNSNTVLTGFPGLDKKFNTDFKPENIWKNYNNGNSFKIIWAPHHTISGQGNNLDYSSFMEYSTFFFRLLKENKEIQIAFKPHPLLKEKLYKDINWGKNKTNKYYANWNEFPNGQLEEGSYIDLFHFSNAMILDSASFIVEYLYFNKPILFTMKDDKIKERFNSFGKEVFNYLYTGKSKEDLNLFIKNQVLNGNDWMKNKRNNFLKEEILPKDGKTASQNIYYQIKKELC